MGVATWSCNARMKSTPLASASAGLAIDHDAVRIAAEDRRLLADEVPNCRLGTLADRLGRGK